MGSPTWVSRYYKQYSKLYKHQKADLRSWKPPTVEVHHGQVDLAGVLDLISLLLLPVQHPAALHRCQPHNWGLGLGAFKGDIG